MQSTGLTTMKLKKINKGAMYRFIYQAKAISKQAISSGLSLGLTTVTQNLKELEEAGMIERNGYFHSTGGRKAQAIRIVPNARISLGVEILKDTLHFAAADLYGNPLSTWSADIPFESSEAYCERLADSLRSFVQASGFSQEKILGVSIAIQGIISEDGKTLSYGKLLNQTTLGLSDFQKHLPWRCRLEHDSKAAAALEIWEREDLKDCIVLLLNKNLGSALVIHRQIHRGIHGHSGTLEHLCLNPEGPLCYCGKRGCLETYCSADSLSQKAECELGAFFQKVRSQEPASLSLWQEYLSHLAFAVRNFTALFDVPVVLSGVLSAYLVPEDLELLYDLLEELSPFESKRDFLHISTHGSLSPAVGASLYFIDEFLKAF